VPKYGRTAVERNRMKRRLREIARVELIPKTPPLDVVVRVTEAAYALPFSQLREDVVRLVQRLTAV
jgi:ribonuclease P protein component